MIQIKQAYYLSKIPVDQRRMKTSQESERLFNRFYVLLGKILDITREIGGFNKFYSAYISMLLVAFGMIGVSICKSQSGLFSLTYKDSPFYSPFYIHF